MYEATGKIKVIQETQTFPSGFSKREFVVTIGDDKYPQDIKYEVVKDKCSMLDQYSVGQDVTVNFDIRGNEYNGKYYVNLSCWKISGGAGGGGQQQQSSQPQASHQQAPSSQPTQAASTGTEPSPDELMNDDIPF